jgi:FixJ family two-component response regulator
MRSGNTVQTALQLVSACIVVVAASAGAMAQAPSASGKPPSAASAATESQTQAREILMRMAQFLAKNQRFSVQVQAGYDAEKTVKAHRSRVMEKMQVRSLAELVQLADRLGVIGRRTV